VKVVGVMSGTSFDAVEAAATSLSLEGETLALRLLGSRSFGFDPELRAGISAAMPPNTPGAGALCRLDTRLGQAFAAAARETAREFCGGRADLVVSHGQTFFHWVEGDRARGTLQLGQPAWISEATGAPVVSDLRSRDVAAGGHGAPLVSLFDVLLLGPGEEPRAALNLGGIANLTVVPPVGPPFAFDVGPANALIDAAVEHLSGGADTFDRDGRHAARGTVLPELLRALRDDPYFELQPPKSTGKERFNLSYVCERTGRFGRVADDDLVATLTALTSDTVAAELDRYGVVEAVASGGGTRNPWLMDRLRERAAGTRLREIEDWGIPSEAKEAYAFAVLGFLTVNGLPGTLPSCTGARRPTVLGSITPGREPLALPAPVRVSPTRLVVEA
jgi:anhydro-N-acetylmuramic acid kinase